MSESPQGRRQTCPHGGDARSCNDCAGVRERYGLDLAGRDQSQPTDLMAALRASLDAAKQEREGLSRLVELFTEADERKRCPMCDHQWSLHEQKCDAPYCSCPEGVDRVWARLPDDASGQT